MKYFYICKLHLNQILIGPNNSKINVDTNWLDYNTNIITYEKETIKVHK